METCYLDSDLDLAFCALWPLPCSRLDFLIFAFYLVMANSRDQSRDQCFYVTLVVQNSQFLTLTPSCPTVIA